MKTNCTPALGGILTGVMVLFVLLFGSARQLGLDGTQASAGRARQQTCPDVTPADAITTDIPGGD